MQFSTLFLISLFSISMALTGCVGSDNSSAPTKPNQPTNPDTNNPNDNTDGDNSSDDGGDNDSGDNPGSGNNGSNDGSNGNGSGDGSTGGNTGGNDITQSLCELPNDNEVNNIFDGIGLKEAYTLGAPNTYIEQTSGTDLTGTWVVVSKTNEQQEDYSQVFYSKSVFVIIKDSNGDYQAANCRATATKQPIYTEQWVDKYGNPVKENCYDYYIKNSNGIKIIQSDAPENCVIRNSEGDVIDLKNQKNLEAVKNEKTETGSVLTPWTTFITANYIDKDGNKTLSLPLPNPVDRAEDKQDLVFDVYGDTFSNLKYSSSLENYLKKDPDSEEKTNWIKSKSNYEAYKVSDKTDPLGTSTVTFDSETSSSVGNIFCITQQYKIEKEDSCGATKTYPGFTVITDEYKYSVDALQIESNALAFSKFTEVATKDNTDIWVNTITQSDTTTSFEPNKMKLDEMLLINNDDDSKKITYKFEVNIPNTTSP